MPIQIPKFEYGFYTDMIAEAQKKFGDAIDLPYISHHVAPIKHYVSGNVLDYGSGKDQPFANSIKPCLKNGRYYTLDNDPCGTFDFNRVEDIPDDLKFGLIYARQVFEHLSIDESVFSICHLANHLEPGGVVVASVPNIAHPIRQWSHITHITYWGNLGFYSLFKVAGLEVIEMGRCSKRIPRGPIERLFAYYGKRVFRMDWCDTIIAVAKKS